MEYAVEAHNKRVKEFVTKFMPPLIAQLKLQNSKKAVLIKITEDFAEQTEGQALHIEVADCYLVLLKPLKRINNRALCELATNLTHEMIHVNQMAKGMFRFYPNGKRKWMGKMYDTKKVNYLDQPWEVDAFSKQEVMVRKVLDAL